MQTVRTNLKINASSQYTNFNHTSMCMFNGIMLGAGTNGLFKACCGNTDNGVAIDAYFVQLKTNFGQMNEKRARYLYFGFESGGTLQATVTGDDTIVSGPRDIVPAATKGQQKIRITMPRSLYSWSYGSVKVNNVAGCDFSVDLIEGYFNPKNI